MKKRILCLLLAVLTVLSCALVGCNGSEDDPTNEDLNSTVNTSRAPKTLNMWVVTEKETTEEAQKQVEAAFNAYTETKYTTHVNLIFCTEDEYEEKLDAQFALTDSRPSNFSFKQPTEIKEAVDPETGMTVMVYPTASEYQVDIVLITGKEMLNRYTTEDYDTATKKGRLEILNTSLINEAKIIQSYIHREVLTYSAMDGNSIYAIPNNNIIGDFTFLMINREMADKYYFTPYDFTTFTATDDRGNKTAVAKLIEEIAKNEDRSKIAPVYGWSEYPLVEYWGKNGAFSVFGSFYNNANATLGYFPGVSTVFGDRNYNAFMSLMYECKEKGYFMQGNEEAFGVGVMTGDYSLALDYSDEYYVTVLDYPHLTDDSIFDSMFAVSKYTTDLTRSMEIITELTCKQELRNILQYGIEGTHYEFNDDGQVVRTTSDPNNIYKMDVNYTGNVLTAYPEAGLCREDWDEIIKTQNQNAALSVLLGSHSSLTRVDKNAMEEMREISQAYFERLQECKTKLEFQEFAKAAATEIANSSYYKTLMTERKDDGELDITSLKGAITKWYQDIYGTPDGN